MDQRLSEHFKLSELAPMGAPPEIVLKLRELCGSLLEPLRGQFGALVVTSGYRTPEHNAAIGGVDKSAHTLGAAADVQSVAGVEPLVMLQWASTQSLPYDQLISEVNPLGGRWLHCAIARPGFGAPRGQLLTYADGVYATVA